VLTYGTGEIGFEAVFSDQMDLRTFPFDRQMMTVALQFMNVPINNVNVQVWFGVLSLLRVICLHLLRMRIHMKLSIDRVLAYIFTGQTPQAL
jgi:hypothetical protein